MKKTVRPPETVDTRCLADTPQDWANLGYWLDPGTFSMDSGHGERNCFAAPSAQGTAAQPTPSPSNGWPPKTYGQACEDLAGLHGIFGAFAPHHRLLDLACGRGASLVLWQKRFGVEKIHAMEPCPASIDRLQKTWSRGDSSKAPHFFPLTMEKALQGALSHGQKSPQGPQTSASPSAPLPHPPLAGYDRIVCVDSAYHFASTSDLLSFARLFLKPGGILVWSNLVYQGALGSPPRWLSLLNIQKDAVVDLSSAPQNATGQGLRWLRPWYLDGGVLEGFVHFVRRRRQELRWRQKFSKRWLSVEATAQALNLLKPAGKEAMDQTPWSETAGCMGYAILGVSQCERASPDQVGT